MGLMKWIIIGTATAIAGPLVIPLLLAGNMDGIDGYDDDCWNKLMNKIWMKIIWLPVRKETGPELRVQKWNYKRRVITMGLLKAIVGGTVGLVVGTMTCTPITGLIGGAFIAQDWE